MPLGDEMMPPMDDTSTDMMNDMPDDNMMNPDEQTQSDFDTNFDAGVEADEDTDPKKYIQQLTGKLSQTLNTYNNEIGEPDVELGKYVLGMLVKQGTKGMGEDDKKEIIKKINTSNPNNEEPMGEPEMNGENEMMDEPTEDDGMQMESKKINFTKKQIFENFGIAIDDNNKNKKKLDTKIPSNTLKNRKTRPFEAPKKFKK